MVSYMHCRKFRAAETQIDGLVQEWRSSSALAMELRLSGTNPSNLPLSMLQQREEGLDF